MLVSDLLEKLWLGIVGLLVAGIGWLIRRVLTNEKQIALLEAEINRRNEDLKEMKNDIKELIRKGG